MFYVTVIVNILSLAQTNKVLYNSLNRINSRTQGRCIYLFYIIGQIITGWRPLHYKTEWGELWPCRNMCLCPHSLLKLLSVNSVSIKTTLHWCLQIKLYLLFKLCLKSGVSCLSFRGHQTWVWKFCVVKWKFNSLDTRTISHGTD